MIKIENLHASVGGSEILKGIDLEIKAGEVHAIMGPNGSGKSTLSKIIAGHPSYTIEKGIITYNINGKDCNLFDLEPCDRAKHGIFLSFQYPVEIPGVTNFSFLQESFNAVCTSQGVPTMDEGAFKEYLAPKLKALEMNDQFLGRAVNEGFSGGEKKKNEILQMHILNPKLALLDETDSGLDIDALQTVAAGINSLKNKYNAIVLVTHYQRLLDFVVPDFIHVLHDGKIIKSGDKDLALELESKGYDWLTKTVQ